MGNYEITATYTGFKSQTQRITITDTTTILDFNLRDDTTLDEIVITGTLKPVSRMFPVPEVYKPVFFRKTNSKHL
jgi:outer membrane receptor for ferrienterochelin and colicins